MHFLGRERERIFDYVANGVMPLTRPGSKNQLDLGPHTPDAAIREIAIQEAAGGRAVHTGLWRLHKLGMIEGIQRLPAKLDPPLLRPRDRLRQVQIEVVRAPGPQRIPAHRRSVGQSGAFYPVDIACTRTRAGVGILKTG